MSADAKINRADHAIISDEALDILFREARTYNGWQDKPVSEVLLKALHDLVKFGPTSANCSPMRTVFLTSNDAKERLKPHLMAGNVDKTMSAPVVAILAFDLEFYEHLPKLFPHTDAKSWFVGNDKSIKETAWRNGTLQAGYFIMAARALGLDCGPMSGFDKDATRKEFFPDQDKIEVNFLCNLGYGDPESIFDRSPRFEFDDVCQIV
ncbi:MAG: malonic semialdehyde reductase [Pseudomonadota bacterium]